MATETLDLEVSNDYSLRSVVFSHGWMQLEPFHWDPDAAILHSAGWIANAPTDFSIEQTKAGQINVAVTKAGKWNGQAREQARKTLAAMLGVSLDLSDFYRIGGEKFYWAKRIGAGRMLRGASVFEDAAKMLATTNCSWSLTKLMVTRIVDSLGVKTPNGRKVFPLPETLAEKSEDFFRNEMKTGYRARYFKEFADHVASGQVDCETWSLSELTTADLIKEIRRRNGFGRYAAENLCKLFGRYDEFGLDSWCLKKFPIVHGKVKGDVEKAIRKHYAPFGKWQGLALWLDLSREWHEENIAEEKIPKFKKGEK